MDWGTTAQIGHFFFGNAFRYIFLLICHYLFFLRYALLLPYTLPKHMHTSHLLHWFSRLSLVDVSLASRDQDEKIHFVMAGETNKIGDKVCVI